MVSLYLSLGLSGVFATMRITGNGWYNGMIYELLVFFFISFLILVVSLEWIVFRRLKNLNLVNQRENQEAQRFGDLSPGISGRSFSRTQNPDICHPGIHTYPHGWGY